MEAEFWRNRWIDDQIGWHQESTNGLLIEYWTQVTRGIQGRVLVPLCGKSSDMVWLATYVAISRVRSLANLRSVGLTTKIKRVIEAGPPDSIPAMFEKYFGEKEKQTKKDADD